MPEIGKRIRARREELGITQEELASRLGYKSKTTIAKIENGTNDIIQSKVIEFAKVLDTTPAYLMGWVSPENNASGTVKKSSFMPDFMLTLPDGSKMNIEYHTQKNFDASKIQHLQKLLSYYLSLNGIGQKKAMDNLEDLFKIYSDSAPMNLLNAAHERTDIPDSEKTKEAKKAEEDIMDDPNF